ncbi:MAG: hypothetical protein AABZ06_14760 [Bdellovibrionota bacterium]
MQCIKIITPLIFFLALSNHARASDFHSPRTAALGGSAHAGPLLNDSIYLNPSFSSFLTTYSISVNYLWFKGLLHGHGLNASIQDGRSEMFQAGVAFTQAETGRSLHVASSKKLSGRLAIGLGGKFFFPDDNSYTQIRDGLLSASLILSDWLHIVGIVDNVIESSEGKARGLYRELILGTKFNIKGIVLVYFDPHLVPNIKDTSSFGHESGLEFPMMSDFFFRLGAFRNSTIPFESARGNGYGIGAGWLAPRISIDYGVSRVLSPVVTTSQSIGMTIFF